MSDGDPLAAIDARIAMLRTIRGAAERYSDTYWDADDTLSWLRMVRDEIVRTGRVRDDAVAFLETPPAAIAIETATLRVPFAALAPEADASAAQPGPSRRTGRVRPDPESPAELGTPIAAA